MATSAAFPTPDFVPNQQVLAELMGMGFDQETATQVPFWAFVFT